MRDGSEPLLVLPVNLDAEQALLAAILARDSVYDTVADRLRPEHFSHPSHQLIYATIQRLKDQGGAADPVRLHAILGTDGSLEAVGGAPYLAKLAASVVTFTNVPHYVTDLIDLWRRRQLVAAGQELVGRAIDLDAEGDAASIIAEHEEALHSLSADKENRLLDAGEGVERSLKLAERAYQNRGALLGLPTGLTDLDKLLSGLQPQCLYLVAGRPSMGKAQPLTAKVLTPSGWRLMGDLAIGDALASVDGQPSVVVGIFPQGRQSVFRVRFSDGRATEASDQHLWRVHYRNWPAPRVLTTTEIFDLLQRKRYQNRLWIDLFAGEFGTDAAMPVHPWLLGMLLGDGCLKFNRVTFTSASEDVVRLARSCSPAGMKVIRIGGKYAYAIVQGGEKCERCGTLEIGRRRKFCSDECAWRGRNESKLRDPDTHRAKTAENAISHHPLIRELKRLGIYGLGAADKFVPPIYLSASRTVRLDVLRGLLDTDGWVEQWGSVRFATASERLADDVVTLVRSLGGWATKSPKRPKYRYKGEMRDGLPGWTVNIAHPAADTLFTLPEKLARTKSPERRKHPVISSIAAAGETECQCITVSHPSRLYVTDDFVVTHNSLVVDRMAVAAADHLLLRRERGERTGVVLVFSLEMSQEQLGHRRLAARTGINLSKIQRGELEADDWATLQEAGLRLKPLPLYTDDTAGLTIAEVRARARRVARAHGLAMIVVDHLGKMRPSKEMARQGQVAIITEISAGLQQLAKDLRVPVVAASQLSRAVEGRDDKRPTLGDLRDSGALEQDADVVMFVFREEYYLAKAKPMRREGESEEKLGARWEEWETRSEKARGVAELLIQKHRNGATGDIRCHFDGALARISDLYREDAP